METALQFRTIWGKKKLPEDVASVPRHLLGPSHEQADTNPPDFKIEPQENGCFSHPYSPQLAGRANSRPATENIPHTIEFSDDRREAIASHLIGRNIAEKLSGIEDVWLHQTGGAKRIALQFWRIWGKKKLPEDGRYALRHLLGPSHKQADANPPDFKIEPQENGCFPHPLSPELAGRTDFRPATRTIPHTIEFSEGPLASIVSQSPALGFKNKNAAWEGTSP